MSDLLTLLQRDCTITLEELSERLACSVEEVEAQRKSLEEQGLIIGYQAVVDWEKCDRITALIEVKVTPQGNDGFDRIAQRISRYEEVESVYLMSSGSYDLAVMISGSTLQEVAKFVSSRLAMIQGVVSTATHFLLKKYKEHHVSYEQRDPEEREHFVI